VEFNVDLRMGEEKMKKKSKSWILHVVKDPDSDGLMLEFPEEVLKAANLKVGDTLEWSIEGEQVILKKIDKELPSTVSLKS
jgi:hypothetical protein